MSKYTTEVRFLCESLTGHEQSVGFNSVNDIINQAVPIIFDFNFPIYDETYRPVLCAKILRHYYTREICEETYGLWKLRLQDRLDTIMPYYNQLYRSALLEFNPFYDVDLTTKHEGNETGVSNGSSYEEINRDNNKNKEDNENVSEVGNKNGGNVSDKTGNNVNKIDESSNESNVKTGDNGTLKTNTGTDGISHTGTVKDDGNATHNIVNSGSEETKNDETTNGDRNTEYSGTNVGTNERESEGKTNGTSNNTQWDLFSDTPQGGIDGFSVPNSSAPSQDLENNIYLTTARKVTDNGATTGNSSESESGTSTTNESSIGSDKNVVNVEGKVNTQKDNTEIGVSSDNNVKTFNESNDRTVNLNEDTVNNYVETNTGATGRNSNENTEMSEKVSNDYNETNVNNIGRNLTGNESETENMSANRNDNKVSTTTDEYLQRVSGKSGGISYSAMLLEYRETFINIDEMIIEELHDLFFGLW